MDMITSQISEASFLSVFRTALLNRTRGAGAQRFVRQLSQKDAERSMSPVQALLSRNTPPLRLPLQAQPLLIEETLLLQRSHSLPTPATEWRNRLPETDVNVASSLPTGHGAYPGPTRCRQCSSCQHRALFVSRRVVPLIPTASPGDAQATMTRLRPSAL
eukprot:m.313846 g.313846  ORF g.313846 m.313846 type:complete len:160 (-) comp55414_c0_seq5:647-1126(-)